MISSPFLLSIHHLIAIIKLKSLSRVWAV